MELLEQVSTGQLIRVSEFFTVSVKILVQKQIVEAKNIEQTNNQSKDEILNK